MKTEITEAIAKAAQFDIELDLSDFQIIDGEITLDGMSPDEWIYAMTMD